MQLVEAQALSQGRYLSAPSLFWRFRWRVERLIGYLLTDIALGARRLGTLPLEVDLKVARAIVDIASWWGAGAARKA